jgi:hypothetical protein
LICIRVLPIQNLGKVVEEPVRMSMHQFGGGLAFTNNRVACG